MGHLQLQQTPFLGVHETGSRPEIMVRVLTTLLSEGVTALPLHDGILVGKSHVTKGKDGMEAASRYLLRSIACRWLRLHVTDMGGVARGRRFVGYRMDMPIDPGTIRLDVTSTSHSLL
jgi:hypothetical protein